jgi:hypothetical protein
MSDRPYGCAVVEVETNRFEVASPGDVSAEGLIHQLVTNSMGSKILPPHYEVKLTSTPPGKYASLPHLHVAGGKGMTFESFREDVGSVVNRAIAEATAEKPATLEAIRVALSSANYAVSQVTPHFEENRLGYIIQKGI